MSLDAKNNEMTSAGRLMYAPKNPSKDTPVRIGVGVIIMREDGNILLEQRADCGMWGLPGGRIEPGETVESAAHREVFEETGLEVVLGKLIGIYSDPCQRIVEYLDNGDIVHLVDVVVEAKVSGGYLKRSSESLDLQYFSPESLPMVVPPAEKPLQDMLLGFSGQIR